MDNLRSRRIIKSLQARWQLLLFAAAFLAAASVVLLFIRICNWVAGFSWLATGASFIPGVAVFFLFFKKLRRNDIVSFLNSTDASLEESAGLLYRDPGELGFLESLQVAKIEPVLHANTGTPPTIKKRLYASITCFGLCALIISGIGFLPKHAGTTKKEIVAAASEARPAGIAKVNISIAPPAYLNLGVRKQDRFNINAEENSVVTWEVVTTTAVNKLELVFNDKSALSLFPTDSTHIRWTAKKTISATGFYQVKVDSALSDLYRLEIIKDAFPVIIVRSPKPSTLIEPGRPKKTQLEVLLTDDHAVKNATIFATIASGAGEAVKFKKQQLVFTDFVPGKNSYRLTKLLDLNSLGMGSGDELYFYISATDSHGQEKRSDIYIVRIEDVTQLLSIDGIMNGIDVKPEFFRSQRQIIIETEQLLKDRDTMRVEVFNERSNELGVDQKLLRLRYGKFLGEETNVEIGKDHDDHDHEGSAHETSETGNAQKMMDEVAHKHDNAEDAGFFDAQTKKQLKATLDEMWKAELQLRTMKPADALPFEYKALKLLKELQQQSRVYVAKTGSRTPPLKLEKRLTGELDKIVQPEQEKNYEIVNESATDRKALGILEQIKNGDSLTPADLSTLETAGIHLGNKAAEEPRNYLPGFESYRKVLSGKFGPPDLVLAGKALQKMLDAATKQPARANDAAGRKLSQQYFMNLSKKQ